MNASPTIVQRLGVAAVGCSALFLLVCGTYTPAIQARSFSAPPTITLGDYQKIWDDQAFFYFRVSYVPKGAAGKCKSATVTYTDTNSGETETWNDSRVVTNSTTGVVKIRVKAKKPRVEETRKGGRGTGTATVVVTQDDSKSLITVVGTMDLESFD